MAWPGIEPSTSGSWVRHATDGATRPGIGLRLQLDEYSHAIEQGLIESEFKISLLIHAVSACQYLMVDNMACFERSQVRATDFELHHN